MQCLYWPQQEAAVQKPICEGFKPSSTVYDISSLAVYRNAGVCVAMRRRKSSAVPGQDESEHLPRPRKASAARRQVSRNPADAFSELERRRQLNRDAQRKYRCSTQQRLRELDRIKTALGLEQDWSSLRSPSRNEDTAHSQSPASASSPERSWQEGEHSPSPVLDTLAMASGPPTQLHVGPGNGASVGFNDMPLGTTLDTLSLSALATAEEHGNLAYSNGADPREFTGPFIGLDSVSTAVDTALHLAVAGAHTGVVRLLLDHGAPVDSVNLQWQTPLHVAAKTGDVDMIECLLDAGATIAIGDSHGMTPLHWAAAAGHAQVLRLLVGRGANPNALSSIGDFGTLDN